jgi:hypothetical protein
MAQESLLRASDVRRDGGSNRPTKIRGHFPMQGDAARPLDERVRAFLASHAASTFSNPLTLTTA